MPKKVHDSTITHPATHTPESFIETQRQEALLKTGALQSAIFNSAYFSSIATDAKGVIQIFNVGAERMLGYMATDVLDKITPADISDPQEMIARAEALSIELGTPITPGFEALVFKASRGIEDIYELTYIRKDGSRFPAVVSVTSLRDNQNAIIGYLLIGTDNSARRQIEAERQHLLETQEETNKQLQQTNITLQASEERLAVTLNSIGDAVIATDAKGHVTLLNPLAEQLTGWTQTEAAGHSVDEIFRIFNKETRQPAVIPVIETLAHGTIQGLANHTVLIARHGGECDIADSCAPIRDRDGKVIGAVLVFRDVTEEYAIQQTLRDNTAQIQTILNTVVDGIITLHASDGIVETVNPAAERMFGYQMSELIGQNFSLLIPELDRNQHSGNGSLEYYSASDEARAIGLGREVVGRRKDGSIFPMEISVSEMRLGGQRYFTGILRDISARKHAEEALLKAGALQKAIFDSANFSSIATDARGVIQIFNVGAERMLGYAAIDVMNKITPADISDPEEVIARARALSAELETQIAPGFEALVFKASRGIEDIYELTYIRKDGSRFPAVVSVTALRDDQNAIIGYLLIGTDNTARKHAEEALLKAGALQKAIFDSANFSSIATDARGVIQIFNVGAERMLGYAAIDVMNKITPADISDPEEVIARARALSAELETQIAPGFEALVFKASRGIEDIYELTYIRKDGSRFPAVVSVTALRDDQNAIIGYLLIGTDNTARKQIEEEQKKLDQRLRDQQFYTRSLIESNIDALMTTDPIGIISDVNKQMEALTGRTRDELIGAPFKNYFTDPERAEAAIKQVLNEKKVINYELTVRAMDGKETVVSYNAATFYDRDRRLQGVFAAARDVTERKLMDRELENARSVAEKANLAKSDFLSSMSHELRTPLNAILGFAQLLEGGSPPPTDAQSIKLQQITKAGWYLLELINQILDLAVIESGKLLLSREPVSLIDIMRECQTMIEPQAQQSDIHINFLPFDTNWFANADRTRVKQVLINLLSNAIKYNREHGTVEVACTMSTPERIRITIKDSGEGLSSEKLAQLFQPFNRLGQETSAEEGTGIGLVVTKQLVELMGGKIGVKSTVGVGSEFWIDLIPDAMPQFAAENSLPAEFARQARGNIQNIPVHCTLLYVEDNPANLMLVEQIIEDRFDHFGLSEDAAVNLMLVEQIIEDYPHVTMLSARDGILGVELACAHIPDVILMDINLPGINGFQALELLRDDPKTKHIPVIAISANAMPRDIEKGMEAGFFSYLTKPIKVSEFMCALSDALKFSEKGLLFPEEV
ncbi:MAG: PAS domain S-box protein [Betaproteobacteria bacterium]|nr:PAS domain S-box protein [Betaproteobacteria bacterium]